MKKLIATTVLASSILFPAFANAENLSLPTKLTAEKKVEIRKGATTSYSIIKTLNAGTKVTIIDEFTNSIGEKWYRVDLGSVKGWGLAAQISGTAGNATVNDTNVNFRKGATTSYPIVGTLQKGARVSIIDSFTNSSKQLWYRVEVQDKTGWVLGTYLTVDAAVLPSNPQKTVIMTSSVRRGATSSYTVIGTVSQNQQVEILDTFTNSANEKWYRVKSGDLTGWVISTAFEAVSADPDPGTTDPGSGTTDPGSGTTDPGSGTTDPGSGTTDPGSGTTDPGSGTTDPGSGTTDPGSGTTDPGSGTTDPGNDLADPGEQLPEYVYALKNSVIRRGATTSYTVTATMKGNERLTVMGEHNGWYNVKTSAGVSGWMIATQTSLYNLTSLISPSVTSAGSTSYLVWKKPSDFNFTYSTTSTNQLKLTGNISEVQLPGFTVQGIKSVTSAAASSTTKTVVITFQPGYTFTIRNNKDSVSIKVMPEGLAGKKIIIDAGHGGKDTGAIGPNGLLEKNANLATALLLKTELEKAGAIVTLTRSTDIFLELYERTDIANLSDADAFISVHSDSFSTTSNGTTTYYNASVNFNGPKSKEMGQYVQQNLVSVTNTYNRGVKEELFYVNRMNELPSILVEMAYISNPKEEALLGSTSFRQKVAVGITKGLQAYFSSF